MLTKIGVPYYRVSKPRQGVSGLGLQAQQKSIQDFAQLYGYELLPSYREVESGDDNERPELLRALQVCKHENATLLIATQDRLSRNMAFVANLMESKVPFIMADDPHAEDVYIHIKAAFSQYERKKIRERTKAALAAAKARGVQLGRYGKEVLSRQNKEASLQFAQKLKPLLDEFKEAGIKSIRAITYELNKRQVPTFQQGGHKWHLATVHRVMRIIKQQQYQTQTIWT